VFLDEEVDGGVDDVVDDGGDREDASEDAHDVDEERVPLFVVVDMQDGHRVGFVSR
jgi:hypothetical protein